MRNFVYVALCTTLFAACGGDDSVDSNEEARRAYLGLDGSIAKAINLGFAGFNASTSANIPTQMTTGDAGGTLTISGQADHGASDNKNMRLNVGMVDYDDGDVDIDTDNDRTDDTVHIVYNTSTDETMQPYLAMQFASFPDGTLSGSLDSNTTMTGVYTLSGDIEGTLTLMLTIAGDTMAGTTADQVVRVPGTTMVTGTATNADGGTYEINITI